MLVVDQFAALPIVPTLLAERGQYQKLYDRIIRMPGAMLGGTLCGKYRRGEPPFSEVDDFAIELYSGKGTLAAVRKLADDLQDELKHTSPCTSPHFIVMKTDIAYAQYSLHLDNARCLATIFELSERTMAAIQHGTKPHIVDGLKLLPTKAQLVDIYRDLYMPRPDLWAAQLPRLRQLVQVVGAADAPADAEGAARERTRVIEKFVRNNPDVMLIGDYAMRLRRAQPYRNRIVQLLGINPDGLARTIAGAIDGEIHTQAEPVMRDARLQRTSIRAFGADIVHIYHNCEYDPIGYREVQDAGTTVRIGSTYALARFILIDFWLLVGKLQAGRIQPGYFEDKKRELLADLAEVQGKPDTIPPGNYLGQFVSDQQHAKNARKEQNFFPYYPVGGQR